MKGFGNNFRTNKKSTEKKVKSIQKEQLITNALSLHSNGKIKEASEIYNFLIKNKLYDPRVLNNLGSIYSQIKQFDKAILLFNESISKFPNSVEVGIQRVMLLKQHKMNRYSLQRHLIGIRYLYPIHLRFGSLLHIRQLLSRR